MINLQTSLHESFYISPKNLNYKHHHSLEPAECGPGRFQQVNHRSNLGRESCYSPFILSELHVRPFISLLPLCFYLSPSSIQIVLLWVFMGVFLTARQEFLRRRRTWSRQRANTHSKAHLTTLCTLNWSKHIHTLY